MTTETQDAGTATNDAGGTQNADTTQATAGEGANKETTAAAAEVDYSFEVPEGMQLDEPSLSEFKAIAKELNLPLEGAKKIHDLAVKREQARADMLKGESAKWRAQVEADPELGKPENLAAAKKAIETFGDPELQMLLKNSEFGNHPSVVRFAFNVSKLTREDKFIANKTAGGAQAVKDHASILYGTTP